jgi:maintenance of morphology protein 1
LPDFQLDLDVNSLLGHKTKVKDLPKLASMLVYRVKVLIYQYLVYPKGRVVNLPSLVKILNGLKPDSPPQAPAPATSSTTTNNATGAAQAS